MSMDPQPPVPVRFGDSPGTVASKPLPASPADATRTASTGFPYVRQDETIKLQRSAFTCDASSRLDFFVSSCRDGIFSISERDYSCSASFSASPSSCASDNRADPMKFAETFTDNTVHTGEVLMCCMDPAGDRVAVASKDNSKQDVRLFIWSPALRRPIGRVAMLEERELAEILSMAWSSCGNFFATKSRGGITLFDTSRNSNGSRSCSTATRCERLAFRFEAHTVGTWVTSCAFSADSSMLLVTAGTDILLLDVAGETKLGKLRRFRDAHFIIKDGKFRPCLVMRAVFSLDSKLVYSGGSDGCLRVWNLYHTKSSNQKQRSVMDDTAEAGDKDAQLLRDEEAEVGALLMPGQTEMLKNFHLSKAVQGRKEASTHRAADAVNPLCSYEFPSKNVVPFPTQHGVILPTWDSEVFFLKYAGVYDEATQSHFRFFSPCGEECAPSAGRREPIHTIAVSRCGEHFIGINNCYTELVIYHFNSS